LHADATDGVVVLSQFHPADAAVLCEADRDPEHRRRFEIPEAFVPSLEHALAVIALRAQEHVDGTRYVFAVRDFATGTLLGGCELRPLGDGAANLSYWTYPPHRRRGVAASRRAPSPWRARPPSMTSASGGSRP
jgi:RimJ/RimL family protein N-acetyltransferase